MTDVTITKIADATEATDVNDSIKLPADDASADRYIQVGNIRRYEVDTITETGPLTARARQMVILNHASVPIALTISGAPAIGDEIEIIAEDNGGSSHTVVLSGSVKWDGTNNIATFDAAGERIRCIAESATRWRVVANPDSVAFSS